MSRKASSPGGSARECAREASDWSTFDNLPVAIAVYELEPVQNIVLKEGQERPIDIVLVYRNLEFGTSSCEADLLLLHRWMLSKGHGESHTIKKDKLQRTYVKRRIANASALFTLTMTDEILLEEDEDDEYSAPSDTHSRSSRSSSTTAGMPDALDVLLSNNGQAPRIHQLWDSVLRKLDPQVQQRIANLVDKAASRSEEEANHVRMLLSRAARIKGLGHPHLWSKTFWDILAIVCDSPFCCGMYWGEDMHLLYNHQFRTIPGARHPECLAVPAASDQAWGDIWPQIGAPFRETWRTGRRHYVQRDLVCMNRNGYMEECYFSWTISRVESHEGSPECLFNLCVEVSNEVIQDRRNDTLHQVTTCTSVNEQPEQYVQSVLDAMRTNPYDVPSIMIYLPHKGSKQRELRLVGSLGVDTEDKPDAIPSMIDLGSDAAGNALADVIRQACRERRSIHIEDAAILAPFDGRTRGWEESCIDAVVYPMLADGTDDVNAVGIITINPRKRFDAACASFHDLLFSEISNSLFYSDTLAARTERLAVTESRFAKMLETSPVGIFECDREGNITYLNPAMHGMLELPEVPLDAPKAPDDSLQWLHPDSRPVAAANVHQMRTLGTGMMWEYRLADGPDGQERWVSGSNAPEQGPDGNVVGFSGYMVDISERRQVEILTNQRVEAALQARRNQNNFIDTTSHELGNALLSVISSVDIVVSNLQARPKTHDPVIDGLVAEDLDILHDVQVCTQHMERVLSDTISMSKIEAGLLTVTPVRTKPAAMLRDVSAMFKARMQLKSIEYDLIIDPSIADLEAEYLFDPARTSQILLNLISNSIKFTADVTGERRITVAASLYDVPPFVDDAAEENVAAPLGVPRTTRADSSNNLRRRRSVFEEGSTECYLHFAVTDTGPGLSEEESKLLFHRFSQCTPKTHIKYGGTGLGTFISRRLTELQGGQIRCVSKKGQGATFEFYIKTHLAEKLMPTRTSRSATTTSTGSEHMLHAVAASLPELGPQLVSATNGTAGVANGSGLSVVVAAAEAKAPQVTASAVASPVREMTRRFRILVVEDNLLNQKLLVKQLTTSRYDVLVANNGREALDQIDRHDDIDLVLLDREMPVLNGYECLRELRDSERGTARHLPVIAISANARAEQIEEMLSIGADGYVTKPFRFADLKLKISSHLPA